MAVNHKCDFCAEEAEYDGKTIIGPWAFMCKEHFEQYGINVKGLFTVLGTVSKQVCRVCNTEKPSTEFYTYTDARGVSRKRTECKECNAAMRKRARMHAKE